MSFLVIQEARRSMTIAQAQTVAPKRE